MFRGLRRTKSKAVLLLQDNVRSNRAKMMLEPIGKVGWELLIHPNYSPNLAAVNVFISQFR